MNKLVAVAGMLLVGATAHAADAENGKKLFESATLGGGTTGKSCMTCHADGAKFGADLFERKEYTIMGMKQESLAGVIMSALKSRWAARLLIRKAARWRISSPICGLWCKPKRNRLSAAFFKNLEGCKVRQYCSAFKIPCFSPLTATLRAFVPLRCQQQALRPNLRM